MSEEDALPNLNERHLLNAGSVNIQDDALLTETDGAITSLGSETSEHGGSSDDDDFVGADLRYPSDGIGSGFPTQTPRIGGDGASESILASINDGHHPDDWYDGDDESEDDVEDGANTNENSLTQQAQQ